MPGSSLSHSSGKLVVGCLRRAARVIVYKTVNLPATIPRLPDGAQFYLHIRRVYFLSSTSLFSPGLVIPRQYFLLLKYRFPRAFSRGSLAHWFEYSSECPTLLAVSRTVVHCNRLIVGQHCQEIYRSHLRRSKIMVSSKILLNLFESLPLAYI